MCNMNKNHLLTLFFHEGTPREEKEIQKHVDECGDCRDYLLTLERTHGTLHEWKDEAPLPNTLEMILADIPETRVKPAAAKPALAIAPLLSIIASILVILGVILLIHDKVTLLPIWESVKEWRSVQFFGSFGVTAVLFFLAGIFVTLTLAPILILELQSKKYRYRFN